MDGLRSMHRTKTRDEWPVPLPRLILIADRFTDNGVSHRVLEAVKAGIRWVHLRDHTAERHVFLERAAHLVKAIEACAPGTLVSINRRLDAARRLDTHLHTSARGSSIVEARDELPPGTLIGYSAHSVVEVKTALQQGAQYTFFSPVFPSESKPGHEGHGLAHFSECAAAVHPGLVYALGGITPERAEACLEAGAYGVAVLSGIMHASDTAAAVSSYLSTLNPKPRTEN